MDKKVCTSCKIEKELNEFHKYRKSGLKLRAKCKDCINKECKIYRENNPEKRKETCKKYRDNNREKTMESVKKWRENNSERFKNYNKEYYYNNIEEIKKYNKEWSDKNRDKIKEKRNRFKEKNPNYINEYQKQRKIFDPIFKLSCNIRTMIWGVFKNKGYTKNNNTYEILGCTFEEFKSHIESQFEPWMNWDNKSKSNSVKNPNIEWDLDHIIPISSAKTKEDLIKLNHYTNLQPLCSYYNRYIKRDSNLNPNCFDCNKSLEDCTCIDEILNI